MHECQPAKGASGPASALKRLFREQPVQWGHGSCCCTAQWPLLGFVPSLEFAVQPPTGQQCSTSSCGSTTSHPWAQNSIAAAAPRTGLGCLVAVPVVRRQKGAWRVWGSSFEAWPHCPAQDNSHPMSLGSTGHSKHLCRTWTKFATSARWPWLPLRILILNVSLLTCGHHTWLLQLSLLWLFPVSQRPSGVQCRMKHSG